MAQPLPRFLRHEQQAEDLAKIAAILLETGGALPETVRGKPLTASADGHRDDRRRGLPMIGRSVSGAINHSDPLKTLIAKENQRPRQR